MYPGILSQKAEQACLCVPGQKWDGYGNETKELSSKCARFGRLCILQVACNEEQCAPQQIPMQCEICCGALNCRFYIAVSFVVEHSAVSEGRFMQGKSVLFWITICQCKFDTTSTNVAKECLYFWIFLHIFFTHFPSAQCPCFTLAKFHIKLPAIGRLSVPAPLQESNTKPFSQKYECYIVYFLYSIFLRSESWK